MKTLKKNYEFKNVLSRGSYCGGKYVDIYLLPNHTDENAIGIAVQKKLGKSVKRNRVRRMIREAYRMVESKIKVGNDIVLMWKKKNPLEIATFQNIKEDIENIFKQKGSFKEKK